MDSVSGSFTFGGSGRARQKQRGAILESKLVSVGTSLITDAIDWRHAVDRIATQVPAGQRALDLLKDCNRDETDLLGPLCVAAAVEAHPFLHQLQSSLRVAILGVECADAGINGRLYGLVPWLIGRPNLKLSIELIGPNYEGLARATRIHRPELPPARVYKTSCGAWIKERPGDTPTPDMLVLFHPCFERFYPGWFAEGELPEILRLRRPTIIFSRDSDEAERDETILRSLGACTTEPGACSMGALVPARSRGADWRFGQTMFTVVGGEVESRLNHEVEAVLNLAAVIAEIRNATGSAPRHADAFKHCWIRCQDNRNRKVARVLGNVYYDSDAKNAFMAEQGVELPRRRMPVENWNLKPALAGEGQPIERAALAARLYRRLTSER